MERRSFAAPDAMWKRLEARAKKDGDGSVSKLIRDALYATYPELQDLEDFEEADGILRKGAVVAGITLGLVVVLGVAVALLVP